MSARPFLVAALEPVTLAPMVTSGPSRMRSHEPTTDQEHARAMVLDLERSQGQALFGFVRPVESIAIGGRLPGQPEFIGDVMTALEMYDSPVDMGETAITYGVASTSIETWVGRTLAQA